jgi:hypothetical protein
MDKQGILGIWLRRNAATESQTVHSQACIMGQSVHVRLVFMPEQYPTRVQAEHRLLQLALGLSRMHAPLLQV